MFLFEPTGVKKSLELIIITTIPTLLAILTMNTTITILTIYKSLTILTIYKTLTIHKTLTILLILKVLTILKILAIFTTYTITIVSVIPIKYLNVLITVINIHECMHLKFSVHWSIQTDVHYFMFRF